MLIQDWGVLKLYHTFLKDWIKVFRNATTDNACDRNIKPLAFTPYMPKKWFNEKGTRMPKMRKRKPTRKPGRNNSLRQNLRKGSQRNRLMKKQKGPTLRNNTQTCRRSLRLVSTRSADNLKTPLYIASNRILSHTNITFIFIPLSQSCSFEQFYSFFTDLPTLYYYTKIMYLNSRENCLIQ